MMVYNRDIADMVPTRPAPEPPGHNSFINLAPPTESVAPAAAVINTDNSSSSLALSQARISGLPGLLRHVSREIPIAQTTSPQTGRTKNMLRKHKLRDQEELLRQKQASLIPKQPPQIPSPAAIPVIEGFGAGEHLDSFDMFNGGTQEPHNQQQKPVVYNFSRPGVVARSSSNNSLNAASHHHLYSGQSFCTNTTVAVKNTDHGIIQYAREESMTNRGRESYAPQALGDHVNSPRRVRRRKHPTPFKWVSVS